MIGGVSISTLIFLLIGIVIVGYLLGRPGKKEKPEQSGESTGIERTKLEENKYNQVREMVFNMTPSKLNLNLSEESTTVYGAIIEWPIDDIILTTVAFLSGDASIYLSSGAMFIGGYSHEVIRDIAKDLIKVSQLSLSLMEKTINYEFPEKDCVKFYGLTNKGIFFHEEKMSSIENKENNWCVVFNIGQNIITQYRLIDQARK